MLLFYLRCNNDQFLCNMEGRRFAFPQQFAYWLNERYPCNRVESSGRSSNRSYKEFYKHRENMTEAEIEKETPKEHIAINKAVGGVSIQGYVRRKLLTCAFLLTTHILLAETQIFDQVRSCLVVSVASSCEYGYRLCRFHNQ